MVSSVPLISDDCDGVGNEEEEQYLSQIKHIMETGTEIVDRTGVGTLSVFGLHSTYSLRNGKFLLSL